MKLALVGSRNYPDLPAVREWVLANVHPDDVVISGGARGVDRQAIAAAKLLGCKTSELLPDWELHGRKAGLLRNTRIVAACDRLVAFWDGRSHGTADTIAKARAAKKPVTIIQPYMPILAPGEHPDPWTTCKPPTTPRGSRTRNRDIYGHREKI